MTRISDPTQIDLPVLREFAVQAVWVAKLEEAVSVLEEFIVDFVEEGRPPDPEPWEEDPLEVALSVVHANYEEADQALEARVTEWLAQDPEQKWREYAPGWVRSLGTNTALAHVQQDPYGRQRVVDGDRPPSPHW